MEGRETDGAKVELTSGHLVPSTSWAEYGTKLCSTCNKQRLTRDKRTENSASEKENEYSE